MYMYVHTNIIITYYHLTFRSTYMTAFSASLNKIKLINQLQCKYTNACMTNVEYIFIPRSLNLEEKTFFTTSYSGLHGITRSSLEISSHFLHTYCMPLYIRIYVQWKMYIKNTLGPQILYIIRRCPLQRSHAI